MKTHVTFMTDLFETGIRKQDAAGDRLLGGDLAQWLIGKSRGGEFTLSGPDQDQTGWSDAVRCEGQEFKLGIAIEHSSVGDGYAEWRITVRNSHGLGGLSSANTAVRRRLCDHVYNVLRDEHKIREIQWTDN
jgi:hypothetical protein